MLRRAVLGTIVSAALIAATAAPAFRMACCDNIEIGAEMLIVAVDSTEEILPRAQAVLQRVALEHPAWARAKRNFSAFGLPQNSHIEVEKHGFKAKGIQIQEIKGAITKDIRSLKTPQRRNFGRGVTVGSNTQVQFNAYQRVQGLVNVGTARIVPDFPH